MIELLKDTNVDFIGFRKKAFTFSAFLVLLGIVSFVMLLLGKGNISVDFTAPQTNGSYISYWKMYNASGYVFGDAMNVQFSVGTPSPTTAGATATATVTETPTITATP